MIKKTIKKNIHHPIFFKGSVLDVIRTKNMNTVNCENNSKNGTEQEYDFPKVSSYLISIIFVAIIVVFAIIVHCVFVLNLSFFVGLFWFLIIYFFISNIVIYCLILKLYAFKNIGRMFVITKKPKGYSIQMHFFAWKLYGKSKNPLFLSKKILTELLKNWPTALSMIN